MGLLDFDKIINNDAFQLGAGILGNNTGHYGQFGPALQGGMNQYQMSKQNQYQKLLEEQKLQLQMKEFQRKQEMYNQQQQDRNATMQATGGLPVDVWKHQNPQLKPTSDMLNYNFSQQDPKFAQYQKEKKTPLVNVNTGNQTMPTDAEIQRQDILARAGDARKFTAGIINDGRSAIKNSTDYTRALEILDTVETGTLEETRLAAKKLGSAFGFDIDTENIADAEQLRVLLGDQVMQRVGETKGAVSEKEMTLFTQYSANYGNTTEGNKKILSFKLAKAKRDMELANMVRSMSSQGKTSLDIEQAVWDHISQNPLDNIFSEKKENVPSDDVINSLLEKYK